MLKQGSVFLLTTDSGDVPWSPAHSLGLFYQDCRFLNGYTLTLNGRDLVILSHVGMRGFEAYHDLVNPSLPAVDGGEPIRKNTIAVRRDRIMRDQVLYESLTITNFGCGTRHLRLGLRFRADFADLFVIKGFVSGPHAKPKPPRVVDGRIAELRYEGKDGYWRTTTISFDPAPISSAPTSPSSAVRWSLARAAS